MPTYIYETIPDSAEQSPERFEVWQSMKDEPLTKHPDTGQRVKRVITGGFGFMGLSGAGTSSSGEASASGGSCCGGGGCGCH